MKNNSENKETKKKIFILVPLRYPVGGIRTYLKYTYVKLDDKKYKFLFVVKVIRFFQQYTDLRTYVCMQQKPRAEVCSYCLDV